MMHVFTEQIVLDEERDEQALILVATQDGHPVVIESEFVQDAMRLRAQDQEAYEHAWDTIVLMLDRVNLDGIDA